MTKSQHKSLAAGRWQELSLLEQLGNIGSEVNRTITWRTNSFGNPQDAFYRALELMDLTIADPRHINRLTELCRTREVLVDWYTGNNAYDTTDEQWQRYFLQFGYAARNSK